MRLATREELLGRLEKAEVRVKALKDSILLALSISDLWLPGDNVATEHQGEAVALTKMYDEFHKITVIEEAGE